MSKWYPNSVTYAYLLRLCIKKAAFSEGKLIHSRMNVTGVVPDRFLSNTMINFYTKSGNLEDARKVFDKMPDRDVFSWTALIAAYSKHGFAKEALSFFYQMRRIHIQPNHFTFSIVLSACAKLGALQEGIEIHEQINRIRLECDIKLENTIVNMYVKCGSIEKARAMFDKMSKRDVVSWNTMIAGYVQNGLVGDALKFFHEMPEQDVVSWNTMIAGYAQNGCIDEALELFQKVPKPNVVSWNAMIAGYAQNGCVEKALKLFRQMQIAGEKPNLKTFASVFQACAVSADLEQGISIHEELIRSRLQIDEFVATTLIDMYAKCGRIAKARELFDTMSQSSNVSWNIMISGYLRNKHIDEALELFHKMPEPDVVTWTTLIVGYMQNGYVDKALKLFQEMPQRDTASWTAMIAGYVLNGKSAEALSLFHEMQHRDVKLEAQTFSSVLPACADLAALQQGTEIHEEISKRGLQSNLIVANALLDMYMKCGSIESSQQIFDNMHQKNFISWTTMIAGYAMHGYCNKAIELFEKMQYCGMKPDDVTLICILSACCHAGLVDEGRKYFNHMTKFYHIPPSIEHYVCMVDLLGRAGLLDEARDFIKKMPIRPDATLWRCFLGACRVHNNTGLGECAAKHLFELDPHDAAPYVLLSNIYSAAGRWDDAENVRNIMKDRKVIKVPGYCWIEINKQVHTFLAEEFS